MNKVKAKTENIRREAVEMEVDYVPPEPLSGSSRRGARSLRGEEERRRHHHGGSHHQRSRESEDTKRMKKKHSGKKKKSKAVHQSASKTTSKEEALAAATEALTVSAKEVVQQKWTKARREMYRQSLATTPVHHEEESASDDDTDATPRMKATRESSASESERGQYESDSSLSSLDGDYDLVTKKDVTKPSEESHPPTDLDFAKGMDSAARKLKRIAKDQEEAVVRKKVDYDHLRDLLEGYANDPRKADHERLNQLLAAMGEAITEETDELDDPDEGTSAKEQSPADKESIHSENEDNHGENNKGGVDGLKKEILAACGVEEVDDFVSIPRTSAMPRKGAMGSIRKDPSKSVEVPAEASDAIARESKEEDGDRQGSMDVGGSNECQEVDVLKRDILKASYGVEDSPDFVTVQRSSAMPRKGAVHRFKEDPKSVASKPSVPPTKPPTSTDANRADSERSSPNQEKRITTGSPEMVTLKRDILEACGVDSSPDFVSVQRKSAMPRKGAVRSVAKDSKSSISSPRTNGATTKNRPTQEGDKVVSGNQEMDEPNRDVLETCGSDTSNDFDSARKGDHLESKPRTIKSNSFQSNSECEEGILQETSPPERTDSYTGNASSQDEGMNELKRDILETCGVDSNADFVSVPRETAMPRKGALGESNQGTNAIEQLTSSREQRPATFESTYASIRPREQIDVQEPSASDRIAELAREEEEFDAAIAASLATHEAETLAFASNESHMYRDSSQTESTRRDLPKHTQVETIQLLMADGDGVKEEEFLVVPNKPPSVKVSKQRPEGPRPVKPGAVSSRAGAPPFRAPTNNVPAASPQGHQVRTPAPAQSQRPRETIGMNETPSTASRPIQQHRTQAVDRHKKEHNNAFLPEQFLEVNRRPAIPVQPRRALEGSQSNDSSPDTVPSKSTSPKRVRFGLNQEELSHQVDSSENEVASDDYKKEHLEAFCPDQFLAVPRPPVSQASTEDNGGNSQAQQTRASNHGDSTSTNEMDKAVVTRSASNDGEEKSHNRRTFAFGGRLIKGRKGRKK